jgi:DNA polymerase
LFTAEDLNVMDGKMEKLDTAGITTKLTGQALAVHCSAAKHLVDTYRNSYDRIPHYWQTCNRILSSMERGVKHQFGPVSTEKDKILLPNGLYLQYKDLHRDEDDSWRFFGKRGEKQYTYGGKIAENVTQALSRIVMTDAMLKISYKVVMTVHDEIVCVVREEEAEEAASFIKGAMSVAPDWCKDLPVACEVSTATSYGEAK